MAPKKKREPRKDLKEKEEMVSLDEAADTLGVSRSTLYRWQNQGRIRGFKVGRQWRFRRSDLQKFPEMRHPSAAAVNVGTVRGLAAQVAGNLKGEVTTQPDLGDYPTTEEEKAVEQLFTSVLLTAMKANASDVHVDATADDSVVRCRIDGVLHETVRFPHSVHGALVACIKTHARMIIDQNQAPQDGRFRFWVDKEEYDVRTATIPAVYGESVVMRLLVQAVTLVELDRVGMSAADRHRYERALEAPSGLLIVTGPTGSGKTTVLYAGLRQIAQSELKIMSIEDPVEYVLPYVTQVAVNRKAGLTFEAAQRAIMRQDPDVVMVGTLQSLDAGELATAAAMTGHLVMTTLHASTAAASITRLLDMGVEPFMVAETLIYVSSQRLARKVCPKCAQPDAPDFNVLSPLAERARAGGYELPNSPKFMRGPGCDNCRGTGYRGRTGIYEVMEVDSTIQRLIADRQSTAAIEQAAISAGMTTLAADGLRKAAEGITTVTEVARLLPQD